MKAQKMLTIFVVVLVLAAGQVSMSESEPMGTAFTYQGRVLDFNEPADGIYGFRFVLFGSPEAEDLLGARSIEDVQAVDGFFTVELDFPQDVFDGNDRWLEIGVRAGDTNEPNEYTILSPRQRIAPTPYALYAFSGAGGGTQGPPGPQGPAGPQGPQGPPGPSDNLGDHTATQNVNLNGHWLSGDGGDEGVFIDSTGSVGIGTTSPVAKLDVSWGTEEPVIRGKNSSSGPGVCGQNRQMRGELGTPNAGVYGQCSDSVGYGVLGYSSSGAIGVRGYSNTSYAGYFDGKGYFSKEVNIDTSGVGALYVSGDQAIWYDGTQFSWGYGGSANYFADPVGIGTKTPMGALDVNGSIFQRGAVLHADYVFEPDYELESIDEHSEFMWKNKHLAAIPKAEVDENGYEVLEVGSHRKGIVEELEKAHIYIEQLHRRLKTSEEENTKIQKRLAALETVVAKQAAGWKGDRQ